MQNFGAVDNRFSAFGRSDAEIDIWKRLGNFSTQYASQFVNDTLVVFLNLFLYFVLFIDWNSFSNPCYDE